MRSIILSPPKREHVPFILADGRRLTLTIREASVGDSFWLAELAEECGVDGAPTAKQSAALTIPAFVHRLEDDDNKRALMDALEVGDDEGLVEVLTHETSEPALRRIADIMEALAPPETKGGSKPLKKPKRRVSATWTTIAFLCGGFCAWALMRWLDFPSAISSLS